MKVSAPVRPYYSEKGASTAFYDLVTAGDASLAGDTDLYASLAPAGGSILELGAGTGRVAIALAERGFHVTGLDLAPAMLAQANAKRAACNPDVASRVRFVQGDMTSFALQERFDSVICTFYALAHLPVGAAWANTFKAVALHLAPGGTAAFHLPVAAKMGSAPPPPNMPVFSQPTADGGTLTLFVAKQTMMERVGRMDLVLRYVVTGPKGVRETLERLTLYSGDPEPYAAACGLSRQQDPVSLGDDGFVHLFVRD
ncbi:bifunctional 2-polyprenyl-6-hydroxyphenol methylase/3-demethylubiquinol 3-O-methyltransferase UbiG [Phenylobacterium sp.]|uniref:class I SAM-dependent methyltransferase n=1 Tax=Phenylobacterium sp. TaxID=1871053 RepID=UPI002723C402|nr:class I SAM-dependent methyltransferase [Phenylobacterium sp.]MDO8799765.1 class I SAM-dependent methyltransferase [Phenylobacterium sp.]